jgi:hypothetical protein
MEWDRARGELVLSSGRRFSAYCGILGVGPESDAGLTAGYYNAVSLWDETIDDERPFSAEERREIADAMIARWNAWAART